MSSRVVSKRVAGLSAAFIIALSAGTAGYPALAQTDQAQSALPQASAIEKDSVYTLNINKRESNTRGNVGEAPTDGGAPLAGATFQIQKLEGDITNQATFNQLVKTANAYNDGEDVQLPALTDAGSQTTGTDGVASFGNLAPGAYLVTETAAPTSETNVYVPSTPFIVFVPNTGADGSSWKRSVDVYPKNSFLNVSKQVVDKNTHAEDEGRSAESKVLNYTLTGVVPATPNDRELSTLEITDRYNNTELRFNDDFIESVRVYAPGENPADANGGTALNADQYEVSQGAYTDGSGDANAQFTVSVKDPSSLAEGSRVVVRVKADLLKAVDQDVENKVVERVIFRDPNTKTEDEPKTTPEDKVITYIGDIKVVKKEAGAEKPLAGAAFSLLRCSNVNGGEFDEANVIQTGETNDQGQLNFSNLHVTNYVDGQPVPTNVDDYCLVETKAPEGFAKPQGEDAVTRIQLTVESRQGENDRRVVEKEIENTSIDTPLLPSTGGMGVLIIALAGVAIIAGGAYAARRNSKTA